MGVVGCTRVRVMDCMYVLSISNCKMDETINEAASTREVWDKRDLGSLRVSSNVWCCCCCWYSFSNYSQHIGLSSLKYESVIRFTL